MTVPDVIIDDLYQSVLALEQKSIGLDDLPLAQLRQALIENGAPIDGQLLLPGSVTSAVVAASLVPTVTALPSTPQDGQVIDYLADATNGIVWRLKYRAASASAYKWEWVGGSDLQAAYGPLDTWSSFAANSWGSISANDPRLTLPALGGDYIIHHGVGTMWGNANGNTFVGVSISGANPAAPPCLEVASPGSDASYKSGAVSFRRNAVSSGAVITQVYRTGALQDLTRAAAFINVRPIRVG